MSPDIQKLIRRIYNTVMILLILTLGVRFILASYGIYAGGPSPDGKNYSREAVSEAFAPMALHTYLCLAFVIGSFPMALFMPGKPKKIVPEKNRRLILERLRSKTDLPALEPELYRSILRQRNARTDHMAISAGLLIVFSVLFMVYVCRPAIWPALGEITSAITEAVFALLICMAIPTGYCIFTAYFCRRSLDKEIELMKLAAQQSPVQSSLVSSVADMPFSQRIRRFLNDQFFIARIRYFILGLAIAFVLAGYAMGGFADVIGKAAKICTECVGLG